MNIGSAHREPANQEPDSAGTDNTDSDLVTFDFRAAFAEGDEGDQERAVLAFLELLVDSRSCQARVVLLTRLRQRAAQLRGEGFKIPDPAEHTERLDHCVQLIAQAGVFTALRAGTLDYADLVAISLDPDRLWQTHQAVAMATNPPPSAPPARQDRQR